jgi:myo-inositol-1(or 4)-monophosphatase
LDGKKSDYVWYIDPLDGTTNFVHGIPYFAVSVALAHKGEAILAVVYNPASGERFTAEKGKGSFLNGNRIKVSSTTCLEQSLLVTGFPYDVRTTERDNMVEFERVTKRSQGVRRTGSAALDLCNVACGRFDGYWEANVNVWDIAAGSLIVTEAGGKVTSCSGAAFDLWGKEILASNAIIHAELAQAMGS